MDKASAAYREIPDFLKLVSEPAQQMGADGRLHYPHYFWECFWCGYRGEGYTAVCPACASARSPEHELNRDKERREAARMATLVQALRAEDV